VAGLAPAAITGDINMAEAKKVKARVLVEGARGKPNDVIEIDAAEAKALAGTVDTDPAAVAYAESLAQ
jgi:glutamate dehydrogenase/leucine dehydrogenase